MGSLAIRHAMRVVAALCGIALLAPLLLLEMFMGDTGWSPGIVLGVIAFGAPCGLFLYFARTGQHSWYAGLVPPLVALAQSAAILAAVANFPHHPGAHLVSGVVASWLVVLGVWALQVNRRGFAIA